MSLLSLKRIKGERKGEWKETIVFQENVIRIRKLLVLIKNMSDENIFLY